MITSFIVILFIIQVISFYFLALLYTKVSNFDNLEKKQRQLMEEMDDSIAAYLTELKDENDRLIDQLNNKVEKKTTSPESDSASKQEKLYEKVNPKNTNAPTFDLKTPVIPLNIALKSYGTPKNTELETNPKPKPPVIQPVVEELEVDERTRAIRLYDAGESVEEIAKILGKGRTEIELILKFR